MFSSRTGSSALCASEKSAEEKDTAAGDEVAMGAGGQEPFSLGRQGGECGLREEREAEHDGGVDPAQF